MKNRLESLINRIDLFSERHKKAIKGVKIFLLLFFIVIMGYAVYLSHVLLATLAIFNGISNIESLTSLVAVCSLLTFVIVGVMWYFIIQLYVVLKNKERICIRLMK